MMERPFGGLRSRTGAGFDLGNPGFDLLSQYIKRDGSLSQHGSVKVSHIETVLQFLFCLPPQFANFDFTNLVTESLARPGNITIDFTTNIMQRKC